MHHFFGAQQECAEIIQNDVIYGVSRSWHLERKVRRESYTLPGRSPEVCSPCWGPTLWQWGSPVSSGSARCGWTWHLRWRRWSQRRRSGYWGPPAPRRLQGEQTEEQAVLTSGQKKHWRSHSLAYSSGWLINHFHTAPANLSHQLALLNNR